MKKLLGILLFIPFLMKAQSTEGVHFEHKVTNWNDVIALAKKENKLVFVDCYTTWCGPCKYVSSKVFPLKNVGDFYNKNFVCVGLQIDQTKKDNEDVVATRAVAKQIEKEYKIEAYPTFLIFDNSGKLVHKFVGAGDDKMMIESAQAALTPAGQYYTLLAEFNAGKRDGAFITNLCKAAKAAGEKTDDFIKAFVTSQENLYTKENGEILLANIGSAEGAAFNQLYKNRIIWRNLLDQEKFDEKMKLGVAADMMEYVAKQRSMNINWSDVESSFKETYPDYYAEQLAKVKVLFAMQIQDWNEFEGSLKALLNSYPNSLENVQNVELLNGLAWSVFENISDKNLLNSALNWSKKSLAKEQNAAFLDTYANLLYKLGKTAEAIETEEKALTLTTDADEKKQYQEAIDKMKKGTKTWKS